MSLDGSEKAETGTSRAYRPPDPLPDWEATQLLGKHLLTVEEVARLFAVSRRTVTNWLRLDPDHPAYLPHVRRGERLLRIPSAEVKKKLAGLVIPASDGAEPGSSLEQDLVACCRRLLEPPDTYVWSDWRLLAGDRQLFSRTFSALAAKTRQVVEERGLGDECWLIAANTQTPGPYACPALQSLLGWKAAYLVNPLAGRWMLYPEPGWSERRVSRVQVVLCDGVRDTGDHLQRAFNYIRSEVEHVTVACVSVVYDNMPLGVPSVDFDSQNRDVPVVSVVQREQKKCEIDTKLPPGKHS